MKSQSHSKTGGLTRSLLFHLGGAGVASMAVATIAMIVAGYLANVPSVLLGNIVDSIVLADSVEAVWPIFGLIVACFVGRVILVVIQKFLVERTAVRVQKRVFLENIGKVLSVRVDALQHLRVGETTVRLEKRTHGTIRLLKLIFLQAFPQIAIAIPALVLAFMQSSLAGTVMIAVLVLSVGLTTWQILSQKGIRIALIDKAAGLAGHVAELLSHLDYVRASGMAGRVRSHFEDEAQDIRKIEFLHHKCDDVFRRIQRADRDGGLAVIVGTGIYQVAAGNMTPGTILALAMLYKSVAIPLQNLHRIVDELYESVLQIGAARDVIEANDDPALAGRVKLQTELATPIVATRNLSVIRKSEEGEEKLVLDRVCLEISAGEVVGIAGPSGGGKTTLLRAMLGLFPDYEGQLRIFGTEVRELSKQDMADCISYGPQQPYVRQGSVRSNIIDGVVREGKIPDADIAKALRRARLDLEPDKILSERGDNISPGQAQRLSLARIFAKDQARFVVLDEATSMLDGSTQAEIMEELREHAEERAFVMVAHRLDTLRWADRILVLDSGRIVQSGTYQELSTIPGIFADLLGVQPSGQLVAAG